MIISRYGNCLSFLDADSPHDDILNFDRLWSTFGYWLGNSIVRPCGHVCSNFDGRKINCCNCGWESERGPDCRICLIRQKPER